MEKNPKNLNISDGLTWVSIITIIFLAYLFLGDFGRFLDEIAPIVTQVGLLYRITYYAAGIIFALFLGTMIFFTIKYWDRGKGE